VQALHPSALRLVPLRALAALAWPAHALLPTRRQRLRLKARVLRRALGALARAAGDGAERARRCPRSGWNAEALCADAVVLRHEALDVLRAVLVHAERDGPEPLALRAAT
jgi:hypothetical protein